MRAAHAQDPAGGSLPIEPGRGGIAAAHAAATAAVIADARGRRN